MKPTFYRSIILSVIISVLSSGLVYVSLNNQNRKTAVVDAVKLFNQYNMKKELEAKEKVRLEAMSKVLDSLTNKIKLAQASKDDQTAKSLFDRFNMLKQQLRDEYTQSNQLINQEVWKRLNPLIEEFGKKKKLHLIIGANGMGSVLYNDEYYDLTPELVTYVNKQYEGQ
ncbi:MAG: OmpH family outer membrane protein [Bacteroidetes bacterium]|nr:OmpH family outer membrane protein [Bacteroidota bacterium]